MTTYYGVWSDWSGRNGKEWWRSNSGLLFRTTFLPVALAQAEVSNAIWKRGPAYGTRKDERWEARAIGEDGLPEKEGDNTVVDLLVDAENRLRELPSVEKAHVIVEFILHRTACLLSPPQFAEYVQGVKAIAKTITEVLGTDRGVSLIGTIGETHAVDIMREG